MVLRVVHLCLVLRRPRLPWPQPSEAEPRTEDEDKGETPEALVGAPAQVQGHWGFEVWARPAPSLRRRRRLDGALGSGRGSPSSSARGRVSLPRPRWTVEAPTHRPRPTLKTRVRSTPDPCSSYAIRVWSNTTITTTRNKGDPCLGRRG